jgi:hypothetical protein
MLMKMVILFLMMGAGFGVGYVPGQQVYSLSGNYAVTINGTLSIHDWTESVQTVKGELVGTLHADGSAVIQTIRMVMEVRSIKGDMGSAMDNKTYKALKAEAYPDITFVLTAPCTMGRLAAGHPPVVLHGRLTLAGITLPVIMLVQSFAATPGKLSIQGEQHLKMTDFGVKPPSALFGTLRAAPDITLHFTTDFINTQP